MNLDNVQAEYQEEFDSVVDWCDRIYYSEFDKHFSDQRELFVKLKDKSKPITDTELESIIMEVPIHMFDVAEALNNFQMKYEILKLETKRKESTLAKESTESSETKRKEDAADKVIGDKVLLLAYSNVIARVEKEMSYSRELIMAAKKLYDRRTQVESANPISEQVSAGLPDYEPSKTYIK